jgi:hypothetical protein
MGGWQKPTPVVAFVDPEVGQMALAAVGPNLDTFTSSRTMLPKSMTKIYLMNDSREYCINLYERD